jgi:guanylate kinase
MTNGPLIILSGPSGSGKSTVVERLLKESGLPLRQSISATTRQPRGTERDGLAYHYWPRERFENAVAAGAFVEWAEFASQLYGTLKSEVDEYRARGIGVILVIDVQGAALVRRQYPDALSIFLKPPTWEVLEQRLRGRRTDDEASIARRLETARRELERAAEYQHVVVSDKLDDTVAEVRKLIAGSFERGKQCSTN